MPVKQAGLGPIKKSGSILVQEVLDDLKRQGKFPNLTAEQVQQDAELFKKMQEYPAGTILQDANGKDAIFVKMVTYGIDDSFGGYIYSWRGKGPGGFKIDDAGNILYEIKQNHPWNDYMPGSVSANDHEPRRLIGVIPDPSQRGVVYVENPVFDKLEKIDIERDVPRWKGGIDRTKSGKCVSCSFEEFLDMIEKFIAKRDEDIVVRDAKKDREKAELSAAFVNKLVELANEKIKAQEAKWSGDEIMWLDKNFDANIPYADLTDKLNATFNTERSASQVKAMCHQMGKKKTARGDK